MIDTDKYEGHTPAPWDVREAGINRIMVYTDDEGFAYEEANRNLVEDAPLLLAELKRLREATQQIIGNIELWCNGNTVPKDILMEKLKEMIE
jgi:hypothetical protein